MRVRPFRPTALALLALLALPAIATADSDTGPRVVVQAPDDPAVRAAVSFPEGWRLEASDEASRREVNALGIDERCEVSTRRSDFADLVTDVDDFVVSLGPGSGFILIERQTVELPRGTAERVDFAANEDGSRWSVYVVPDDGYMHELWCRGDELPDDRWLPIAETFDLAPDDGLVSSPFEPLVPMPDAGATVAFGEEWRVRGSSTNQGLLYATGAEAVCSVSDYSAVATEKGWTTVDDMHDEYVEVAESRQNLAVEEAAYLDLPAGRTGLADIAFDDGTRAIRYSFADPDGETLLALFCVGDPTPEDRYLELAESLEWTP